MKFETWQCDSCGHRFESVRPNEADYPCCECGFLAVRRKYDTGGWGVSTSRASSGTQ